MGSIVIPSQQKAAIRQGVGPESTTSMERIYVAQPGPGQILVKINWTGLCGSDKSLLHNEWKDFGLGMETKWKVGDRAGVKWIASTCGETTVSHSRETRDIAAEVMKITKYGAHGVIVTAATRAAYESAPTFLRPNGTVVAVGLPQDISILAGAPPMTMVLRRLNIVGSVVGSLKEVEEALDFTARGLVRLSQPQSFYDIYKITQYQPILSRGKIEDLDEWVKKLANGQVAGRCVLQVAG
ncbi:hypothetical protein FZEAL_2976 [Fusarium zealandicum]|uniref:Alcohol dehydrogenase-like C-terminal domain-containing protein n=1 Tax=Fusarium zealandicum TaxID=1053134 RepID=A0A8H4XMX5_9HYPO|nr:hypothetical protein FZEAL_2976 [Fusarium zealandicum]